METFACGNCGKDFALSEQTKVHWMLHAGALLITWGLWWPSKVCAGCHAKVSLIGGIGLLLGTVVVIAVLFKMLGQALA